MDKRCFRGIKKARKLRVYELLDWCGKRDLNALIRFFRLFAALMKCRFYGISEESTTIEFFCFSLCFWGIKEQIRNKISI